MITEMLCIGTHEGAGNKKLTGFRILNGEHAGEEIYFLKSKSKAYCGYVYDCELKVKDGKPSGYADLTYNRSYEDEDERRELIMQSRLTEQALDVKRNAAKFDFDELYPEFEMLRMLYRKTNPVGKRSLEIMLLNELRK